MTRTPLKLDFLKKIGMDSYELKPLQADASFRTYDRLHKDGKTYILMNCPPEHYDTKPFVDIASLLKDHSFPAPEIYHIDSKNGFIVLEDFGTKSLKDYLLENLHMREEIYKEVINLLVAIQKTVPTTSVPAHSVENMLQGLEVYADWYVPHSTGEKMSESEKAAFLELWYKKLESLTEDRVLALRDYHVENLMYVDGALGLLDFQDATQSHPAYDLVSLLEDARIEVPRDFASQMIEYYLQIHPEIDRDEFLRCYKILSAQRNMRILGVFARKAVRDGASQYLNLIPRVLGYLEN